MRTEAVLLELGGVIVGLAILARIAGRLGVPTIPLYLTAGLAFGRGGFLPLVTTEGFVEIGAEIGLILLLFMLGLEYTARELLTTLRVQAPTAVVDLVLNFLPGAIAGMLLGWSIVASVILGGVTYVSSSGIIAKLLQDFGRIGNRETPIILSVLVIEDSRWRSTCPSSPRSWSEAARWSASSPQWWRSPAWSCCCWWLSRSRSGSAR